MSSCSNENLTEFSQLFPVTPDQPSFELHHGDCLEVMKTLPDNSFRAVLTDPPYASTGRSSNVAKNTRPEEQWFLSDAMGGDSYAWWMRAVALQALRVIEAGGQAYVFTDWRIYSTLVAAWESAGWTLKNVIVWDKNQAGALGAFWRNNHEWVCAFGKGRVA